MKGASWVVGVMRQRMMGMGMGMGMRMGMAVRMRVLNMLLWHLVRREVLLGVRLGADAVDRCGRGPRVRSILCVVLVVCHCARLGRRLRT